MVRIRSRLSADSDTCPTKTLVARLIILVLSLFWIQVSITLIDQSLVTLVLPATCQRYSCPSMWVHKEYEKLHNHGERQQRTLSSLWTPLHTTGIHKVSQHTCPTVLTMKTAKSTLSSQNDKTNKGLVFFPQYSLSNEVLRWVLWTLIVSQIINLSCIITVVVMIATTIGVYNTINDTMLEKNIEPYIANAQSVPVIVIILFFLVPLRTILWKHST